MSRFKRLGTRGQASRRGDARWWLLGVIAICVLGWLWLRSVPSGPRPARPGPEHGQGAVPEPAVPLVQTQPEPQAPEPTKAEPTPPEPALPANLTPGAMTPLGPVIVRTNPPAPAPATNGTAIPTTEPTARGEGAGSVFEVQLALARRGFSPGSIDGKLGFQTRAALRAFQEREGLAPTGSIDAITREHLVLEGAPYTTYEVTQADLAQLRPVAKTWLAKSEQDRMDYETILEMVAERRLSHPSLIVQLNPGIDWARIGPGQMLRVPAIERPTFTGRAASVRISLGSKTLQAFDGESRLMLHFPCSIARDKEKRPLGELHVEKLAQNPNYTFNPEVFPESEEARQLGRKLILQPGPNNPVGTAWISLDRPGYGIHGTPGPEQVGRTESHGCFRLANWNAEALIRVVWVGMPVFVDN